MHINFARKPERGNDSVCAPANPAEGSDAEHVPNPDQDKAPVRKSILDDIFPIQESILVNPPIAAEAVRPSDARTSGPRITNLHSSDKTAKIMIVDDEPLNVMTFRQHLKMAGYENFVTTSDSREALHLIRHERPDVLLLDIRMPEISGLDILRVIGLDPVLQHIPVLILTAAVDPATRKQALDLGASDFLQKPIEPNELLPRVRNAIVIKKHYDMASSEAARLEQQIERRTRQLEATRQHGIIPPISSMRRM